MPPTVSSYTKDVSVMSSLCPAIIQKSIEQHSKEKKLEEMKTGKEKVEQEKKRLKKIKKNGGGIQWEKEEGKYNEKSKEKQ